MNYTDIENFVLDKGTDEEEVIINWRNRRGKIELLCPKCFEFFTIPKEIRFDPDGYASDKVYHFCSEFEDVDGPVENNDGWVVMPHLVGYQNGR